MRIPHLTRCLPALLLAAVPIISTSCTAVSPPRDTHDFDVRTIKDGELLWARHWSTRDADRIVSHFSEDAIWMAPHMPFANGREAIRATVAKLVQDANFAVTFDTSRVDTAKSGEIGYSQGTYAMTLTDPVSKKPVSDEGSYVRLYRRGMDGGWRVFQEINTSSPVNGPVLQ